jgi:hypothetical protein
LDLVRLMFFDLVAGVRLLIFTHPS